MSKGMEHMKSLRKLSAVVFAGMIVSGYTAAQQPPQQQQEHQHPRPAQKPDQKPEMQGMQEHAGHQMAQIPPVKPEFPHLGKTQEQAKGPLMRLETLQQMAAESNPTLRQAEAEIRSAKARQQQ